MNVTVTNGALSAGTIDVTGDLMASENVTTTIGGIDVAQAITSTTNVTSKLGVSANATDVDGALVAQSGDVNVTTDLTAGSVNASGSVVASNLTVAGTTVAGTNIDVANNADFNGTRQRPRAT